MKDGQKLQALFGRLYLNGDGTYVFSEMGCEKIVKTEALD